MKTLGETRKEIDVLAEILTNGTEYEKDLVRMRIQHLSPKHKQWLNMALITLEEAEKHTKKKAE